MLLGCLLQDLLLMLVNSVVALLYNKAGKSLHDDNVINAIKIAGTRVRYHAEDTL